MIFLFSGGCWWVRGGGGANNMSGTTSVLWGYKIISRTGHSLLQSCGGIKLCQSGHCFSCMGDC